MFRLHGASRVDGLRGRPAEDCGPVRHVGSGRSVSARRGKRMVGLCRRGDACGFVDKARTSHRC